MAKALIVARMDAASASSVADIFARSDSGELPRMVGVTGRSLFEFHGLYFHLVESENDIRQSLAAIRDDRRFAEISQELASHISPYDPLSWRGPEDAMARRFYVWHAADQPRPPRPQR